MFPRVQRVLAEVVARLRVLLPDAEIEHIGATAIPGALTKGDLDVMVRVLSFEFQAAAEKLKTVFSIKQPTNWTENFASFGEDHGYELPLGIQLVAKDSDADFFVFLRDYFTKDSAALAKYNQLKILHASQGPESYWEAKNTFFSEIIALKTHEKLK